MGWKSAWKCLEKGSLNAFSVFCVLCSLRMRLGASVSDGKLCMYLRSQFVLLTELYAIFSSILYRVCVHFFYFAWNGLVYASDFAVFFDCSIQEQHQNTQTLSVALSLAISFDAHKLFIHFIYHFIKLWTFFLKQVYCVLYTSNSFFVRPFLHLPSHFCHLTDMLLSDNERENVPRAKNWTSKREKREVFDGCVFQCSHFIFSLPLRHFYRRTYYKIHFTMGCKNETCISVSYVSFHFKVSWLQFLLKLTLSLSLSAECSIAFTHSGKISVGVSRMECQPRGDRKSL